ncbi:MAG: hypothetical protein LBI19_07200 [Oscillospiraceae bacterium]|jgi:hypothetical protein|nr:hypothetical protein [Oscillospiraceae bacterium]
MRKAFLALAMAVVLVAMLAVPAIAANVNLTVGVDLAISDDRLSFYATVAEGEGDPGEWAPTKRALTPAELAAINTWVIEFSSDASARNIAVIFQYEDSWWNQTDDCFTIDGAVVTVDVAKIRANYPALEKMGNVSLAKFTLADWDSPITISDIKSSYAVTSGGGGGGGGAARTGDTTLIMLAITALALAAGATVLIVRKIKA